MDQTLNVKVIPHASRDAVIGWVDEAHAELVVKVTAPAEAGKANAAVIKLLANELKIPKTAITLKRGSTSRHKQLAINISPEKLSEWLAKLTGENS